ncbi:MAG: NADH-quinone oxidoreductase subunit C [Candidatus Tectimicrobiota bacterium]
MTPEEIYRTLQERFSTQVLSFHDKAADPSITVEAAAIYHIGEYLKYDPECQFDSLMCLSGVDYGSEKNTVGVVYNLHSMTLRHKITIKVELPRQGGTLPTVCDLWHTAEWHEREAYDMYGMRFTNHPDHRRILLPDDWEGYPLLKDYQVQEFYHGIKVPYVGDPPSIGMDVYRYQDSEP